jgi:Flp pilus assembly CpaE family ATPase
MQLHTREHSELMERFEREFKSLPVSRKEPKEYWSRGIIYCHGETNNTFLAYRMGYAFGRAVGAQFAND